MTAFLDLQDNIDPTTAACRFANPDDAAFFLLFKHRLGVGRLDHVVLKNRNIGFSIPNKRGGGHARKRDMGSIYAAVLSGAEHPGRGMSTATVAKSGQRECNRSFVEATSRSNVVNCLQLHAFDLQQVGTHKRQAHYPNRYISLDTCRLSYIGIDRYSYSIHPYIDCIDSQYSVISSVFSL